MQITRSGLKRPEIQEINIESFGENVTILDEHLRDTDIHVNAGKIAEITEPDELTQIDSTDTNSTLWGKIKKSISILKAHVDKVASETTLGHIKIGTGLQMTDDVASVKIANDLVTEDATTVLSANMGVELIEKLEKHAEKVATDTTLGHIKIGTGLQMQDGTANVKIANNLTTNDSTTALSAAMGVELVNNLISKVYPIGSIYMSVNNVSPANFIGGTWAALKDRFLLGSGGSYAVDSVGGESTHLLTTNELPSDIGTFQALSWNTEGAWGCISRSNPTNNVQGNNVGTDFGTATYKLSGGNVKHNNMPPYLAVYMWKRIK